MAALVRFDDTGGWGDTFVCDGLIQGTLQSAGVHWGRGRSGPARSDSVVHTFAGDAGLVYLRDAAGWLALLCEPGEFLRLPPGFAHVRVGRQSPPAGLPGLDDFITRLLALTGHGDIEENP